MPNREEIKKDIAYYLSLPYTIQIRHVKADGSSYFYANVKELAGCHTTGSTWEQVYVDLQEVLKDHIEIKLEYGDPIPEPQEA